MVEANFDLYGALTIRLDLDNASRVQRIAGNLDMLLEFFAVQSLRDPQLTIRLGPFMPQWRSSNGNVNGVIRRGNGFRYGRGYIYSEHHKKAAAWRAELRELEGHSVVLNLDSNLGGHLFYPARAVEPVIRVLLFSEGYLLVHAASVSIQERAILVAGPGGIGKTTWALTLVNEGYNFLGDDFVAIRDGVVHPFPKFLHVFDYHLTRLPLIGESVSLYAKALLKLKWLLFHSSFGYAKLFSHFSPTNVRDLHLSRPCGITKAIVVDSALPDGRMQEISPKEAAALMALHTLHELHDFLPGWRQYAAEYKNSRVAKYIHGLEEGIQQSLRKVECWKVGSERFFEMIQSSPEELS